MGIYIDNPVGAGFSFSDALPTTQEAVTDNLYEFLQQWYTLFPTYQSNPFYAFGSLMLASLYLPLQGGSMNRMHQETKSSTSILPVWVLEMDGCHLTTMLSMETSCTRSDLSMRSKETSAWPWSLRHRV